MSMPATPEPVPVVVTWEPTPEDPDMLWTIGDTNGCFAVAHEQSKSGQFGDYDLPVTVTYWSWTVFGEDSLEVASGSEPSEEAAKRAAERAMTGTR